MFGAYTPEGFQNSNMNPVADGLSNFPTMSPSMGVAAVAADGGVLTLDYAVSRSGGR